MTQPSAEKTLEKLDSLTKRVEEKDLAEFKETFEGIKEHIAAIREGVERGTKPLPVNVRPEIDGDNDA